MPMRFFVVDTKNEVFVLHVASTQLGLLHHNRGVHCRHFDTISKYTSQPENTSTTTTVHPFQDHNTTVHLFQNIQ